MEVYLPSKSSECGYSGSIHGAGGGGMLAGSGFKEANLWMRVGGFEGFPAPNVHRVRIFDIVHCTGIEIELSGIFSPSGSSSRSCCIAWKVLRVNHNNSRASGSSCLSVLVTEPLEPSFFRFEFDTPFIFTLKSSHIAYPSH